MKNDGGKGFLGLRKRPEAGSSLAAGLVLPAEGGAGPASRPSPAQRSPGGSQRLVSPKSLLNGEAGRAYPRTLNQASLNSGTELIEAPEAETPTPPPHFPNGSWTARVEEQLESPMSEHKSCAGYERKYCVGQDPTSSGHDC